MTAKEDLDALIECRDALEEGDEADRQMAERANDRLHEALVDAWFTGELDETKKDKYYLGSRITRKPG